MFGRPADARHEWIDPLAGTRAPSIDQNDPLNETGSKYGRLELLDEAFKDLLPKTLANPIINVSQVDNVTGLDSETRGSYEIAVCAVILSILLLAAIIGNIAVIYATFSSAALREHTCYLFVVNLAITDLSCAVIVIGTSLVMLVLDGTDVHPIWCNFVCAANYTLIIASILTMAYISVDRYIAVMYPLKHTTLVSREIALVQIVYAWGQGVVFASIPVALGWITYDYWEVTCAMDWLAQKTDFTYYVIVAFAICFVIPASIIVFCYTRIIFAAHRQKTGTMGISQKRLSKDMDKIIKSLIVVVVFFFIFLTPFCITKVLKVVLPRCTLVPGYVNLASSYLQYGANVVNPFIYCIFRRDFRSAYRDLWHRLVNKHPFGSLPKSASTSSVARQACVNNTWL